MVFCSVYEITDDILTIRKARMWCWFDGGALHDRWTTNCVSGISTFGMSDEIGEGFEITTAATSPNRGSINFCATTHYNCDGAIAIGITRSTEATSRGMAVGLSRDCCPLSGSGCSQVVLCGDTGACATNSTLLTACSGCCFTATSTCVAHNEVFHTYKIQLNMCDATVTIDGGCILATNSCNLPNQPLQPIFIITTRTAATRTGQIRYFEAYNT